MPKGEKIGKRAASVYFRGKGKRRIRREALLDYYLSTYAPKTKTEADAHIVCRNCNKCSNKYCYCLQHGYFCSDLCKCRNCRNREDNITEIRAELRSKLLKRFKGKDAFTLDDVKRIISQLWDTNTCQCTDACRRGYCGCK